MMSPVSIEEVVAGEIIWAASKAFFSTLAVMIVIAVLGLVQTSMAWYALPFLFLLCLTMSALSMVMTSFARDYDSFTYYFSLFITPMSLLAGTFFPLTHFPKWAQIVAQFLPLTHAVIVARALFLGKWENTMWINVGLLALLGLLFSNWAINQTKRRLIY
jgi:lipooligosaccharide transport system permease protein